MESKKLEALVNAKLQQKKGTSTDLTEIKITKPLENLDLNLNN